MTDDSGADEIVAKFFLDSCCMPNSRYSPTSLLTLMRAAVVGCQNGAFDLHDAKTNTTATLTGSSAELYINPLLSCVCDIDTMLDSNCQLAIPGGSPPPIQLPAEFGSRAVVYEIINSAHAGYVYLVHSYLLTECTDDFEYRAEPCERLHASYDDVVCNKFTFLDLHGPAITTCGLKNDADVIQGMPEFFSVDVVPCVRCLLWPPQAADWPIRHRNYGWPDSATLDRVVSNGCDVVTVAHRQCRQHEGMGKHQYRLSFSRAEIVLLNSWILEQQIVYHMLRAFVKSSLSPLSDDSADGAGTLSNYHTKTLMLWACELRPRSWWTDDKNLVEICVELLHILGDWLVDAICEHYFICNCNLLDGSNNSHCNQIIGFISTSVTRAFLASCYVDNYIRKCAYGDEDIFRMFDDVSTSAKIQHAVFELLWWRRINDRDLSYGWRLAATRFLMFRVSALPFNARSTSLLMTELAKRDHLLLMYFISYTFLHIVVKTIKDSLTDELLDVLATIYRFAGQMSTTDEDLKNFYESVRRFIGDVLGIRSVRCAKNVRYERRSGAYENDATPMTPLSQLNKPELVELLQQSAVEHLTTFRYLATMDSKRAICLTDFEALYAYKRGDYQLCKQCATFNVLLIIYTGYSYQLPATIFVAFPEIIQLMPDDIVSLRALSVMANHLCKIGLLIYSEDDSISQLILSLYLMTECQIKLGHSLLTTLDYITRVRRQVRNPSSFDGLLIKLVENKARKHILPKRHCI